MRRRFVWRHATVRQVDCRHVGAWLQAYLDNELDQARHHSVSRHLRQCRRCGMELSDYRQLQAALRRGAPAISEAAAVNRLRDFAERLAAGGIDFAPETDRRS